MQHWSSARAEQPLLLKPFAHSCTRQGLRSTENEAGLPLSSTLAKIHHTHTHTQRRHVLSIISGPQEGEIKEQMNTHLFIFHKNISFEVGKMHLVDKV